MLHRKEIKQMNWKKTLVSVTLVSLTALAMVGCSKAEETAPAATQSTPATQQVAPADKPAANALNTRPAPPTDNGTMPMPPNGGAPGEKAPAPVIDYAAASAKLGVTETQLREALGDTTQGPSDFAAAAKILGVSEEALQEALGLPAGGPPPGNPPSDGSKPPTQGQ
jgi:hypothetical protein